MPEKGGRYKRLEPARLLFRIFGLIASPTQNEQLHNKYLTEKPKVALDRNPLRFGFRLLIHVISLGMTLTVVQLSFRGVYWLDIGDMFLGFSPNQVLNGLQFVAKIHEILMVCSLSAIVLQCVRLRLIGRKGLPLGLLTTAYTVGSAEFLKSKAFRVTGFRRETWIFGVFISSITLLACLLGPSSAIAIIPNLDWWPVPYLFPANMLPIYVTATVQELWPLELSLSNASNLTAADCGILSSDPGCPNAGYEAIQGFAESYANNLSPAEIGMVDPSSNAQRILTSGLTVPLYTGGAAISTSLSQFASTAIGSFWNYVSGVKGLIDFNRARLQTNAAQELYQPLVQVICDTALLGQGLSLTGQNFSSISLDSFYQEDNGRVLNWPVPDWLYNYSYTISNESKTALAAPGVDWLEFGSLTNFSWVNLDPSVGASIGAIIIAPYILNETTPAGDEVLGQAGVVYGCTIDARWAGTQLLYDPLSSQTVQHNLTSLLPSNNGDQLITGQQGNYTTAYGISSVIQIDTSWADQLNPLVQGNGTALTTFQGLFAPFISDLSVTSWGPSPNESFLFQFSPPTLVPNSDLLFHLYQSANTIALLISLMVTDGLARIGSDTDQFISSAQFNSTWSSGTDIKRFIGPSPAVIEMPTQQLTDCFTLDLEASRYGFGYGITSPTVQFGIAVLLIYVTVVTVFLVYVSYDFFFGHGWTSSIWGELQEFVALAINSHSTDELENTCAGIEQTSTWLKNVRVREISDSQLGLVVGVPKDAILGVVMQDKEYGTTNEGNFD